MTTSGTLGSSKRAPDTLLILAAVALFVVLIAAFVPPGRFAKVETGDARRVTIELSSFEYVGEASAFRCLPKVARSGYSTCRSKAWLRATSSVPRWG